MSWRSQRSANATPRRVEQIALHVLRDPEDARDAAQEALVKLVAARRAVSRAVAVLDVAPSARREHLQGRCAGPLAAQRRTEPLYEDVRVASDGDPARALAESETRLELGRCLAELPAAQATVVALKDGYDARRSRRSRARPDCPSAPPSATHIAAANGLRARLSA